MLRRSALRIAIVSAFAAGALLLGGCTSSDPADPAPTAAPLSTASAQPPEATEPEATDDQPAESDPVFVEGGSAADNAPFARLVVQQRADSGGDRPSSAAVADALTAGGFDRAVLEVTADRTPLGLPTDVITFAVRVDDDCIIGELRGSAVTTTVAPVLGTGRCLVGADASID